MIGISPVLVLASLLYAPVEKDKLEPEQLKQISSTATVTDFPLSMEEV